MGDANTVSVRVKLGLFKTILNEMKTVSEQNLSVLESCHFKVRTLLRYYLNDAFLQGAIARASSLINNSRVIEATHYLNNILRDAAENYLWLKSSIAKSRIDYTTLMRSLVGLEENNPRNCENIMKFFALNDAERSVASLKVEKVREIASQIRKDRKLLIKNQLLRS